MYKITIDDMNLHQIMESGQIFRMHKIEDSLYSIIAFDKYLEIRQQNNQFVFSCSEQQFLDIWIPYFDLKTDYGAIKQLANPDDTHLNTAIQFGDGIRILKQDLWEMIITFLISQNNNIVRIKRTTELLCQKYGEKHSCNGNVWYGFAAPETLCTASLEELKALGLGYRDKYILHIAKQTALGHFDLNYLRSLEYDDAHSYLMQQYGIGKKVADCICLFGLYHIDAFPVDSHIKKILDSHYPNGFPVQNYKGYRGIFQQYLFYYDLKKGE